jgi:ABC-type transport system involved in cytochrome bd biosynthesis fused ATPase/permease subunit
VLDEGRLVESGTHAELLRRGGLFAMLYGEQFERQSEAANGFAGRAEPQAAS